MPLVWFFGPVNELYFSEYGPAVVYIQAGYRFAALLPGFGMTRAGAVYDLVRLYKPPEWLDTIACDLIHVAAPLAKLHAFMAREYDTR